MYKWFPQRYCETTPRDSEREAIWWLEAALSCYNGHGLRLVYVCEKSQNRKAAST